MIQGRFEQAEWLMAEIDHRRDQWAAARHPFYRSWAAGALTAVDLQTYAAEHHHVVLTLAAVARRAAALAEGMLGAELSRQARDRDGEVDVWCRFALATGWDAMQTWWFAADPLPETEAAAAAWLGDDERSLTTHLVTIYALETGQGDVARPALDGLLGHYGLAGTDAARYFELRLRGNAGPAGLIEAALTGLLPLADPLALLRHAEHVYRGYWDLLDGISRAARDAATTRRPERSALDSLR
ncbi:MAG TPA: hypothetical protein VE127_04605 [Solirubrobacteraceae bacterium]|nr:hypothetical protein [Solirubrobacteraceae bacterium]